MDYVTEIVYANKVIANDVFRGLSNPNQVLYRMSTKNRDIIKNLDSFSASILNDKGYVWVFYLEKNNLGKFDVVSSQKGYNYLTDHDRNILFSGNGRHYMGGKL